MYATYSIEFKTNNLEFLQIYDTRQEAIQHLKRDVIYHFEKCCGETPKWIEADQTTDEAEGIYLQFSQKVANQIRGFKESIDRVPGWIFTYNLSTVNDLYTYSVCEVPTVPLVQNRPAPLLSELRVSRSNMRGVTTDAKGIKEIEEVTGASDAIILELKACLKSRRASVKPRGNKR